MNKREQAELVARKRLQDKGWQVRKRDAIRPNWGSETEPHLIAKALTMSILHERDYRIDTEVVKEEVGEADVVAYGQPGEPFVVELEHDATDDVVKSKLRQFYDDEPFREVFVVELNDMPLNMLDARRHIEDEVF